ncbi:hypothetical protein [Cetobacterium sp.]|uniref:hypothetical protein n=1 Tax=Cetobacterium sp. TaxID=2071632 RepID=UPI003F2B7D23
MIIKNINYYDHESNNLLNHYYLKKDNNKLKIRKKKFEQVLPGSKFEFFLKNKKIIIELKVDFNLLLNIKEYINEENLIVSSKAHDLIENEPEFNSYVIKENIILTKKLKELFVYYSKNKKFLNEEIYINLDFNEKINISNDKIYNDFIKIKKNEIYKFIFSNLPLGFEINLLINTDFKELRKFFLYSRKNKYLKELNYLFDEINKKTKNEFYKICEFDQWRFYKN